MADDIAKQLVKAAEKAISRARFIDGWVSLGELATAAVLRELADNPGCDLIALAAEIESELPSR